MRLTNEMSKIAGRSALRGWQNHPIKHPHADLQLEGVPVLSSWSMVLDFPTSVPVLIFQLNDNFYIL